MSVREMKILYKLLYIYQRMSKGECRPEGLLSKPIGSALQGLHAGQEEKKC